MLIWSSVFSPVTNSARKAIQSQSCSTTLNQYKEFGQNDPHLSFGVIKGKTNKPKSGGDRWIEKLQCFLRIKSKSGNPGKTEQFQYTSLLQEPSKNGEWPEVHTLKLQEGDEEKLQKDDTVWDFLYGNQENTVTELLEKQHKKHKPSKLIADSLYEEASDFVF